MTRLAGSARAPPQQPRPEQVERQPAHHQRGGRQLPALQRLAQFAGQRLVGSGTDDRILLEAGIREADCFVALASGDNRNILASQKAKVTYGVATVVTSRAPSGDTARPANRGRSWKACRSPHGVTE